MKPVLLIIILGLSLLGCQKDDPATAATQSYELLQHPTWAVEDFKKDYTIQFPSAYTGAIFHFEGNSFTKRHDARNIFVAYIFSNGFWNYDFGDTLVNPFQPSVWSRVSVSAAPPVYLDHRVEFTKNSELAAVLYHNNNASFKCVLYWKDGGVFKNAVFATAPIQEMPEIIEIFRTIKPK